MLKAIRKALARHAPRRLSGEGLVPAAVLLPLYERGGELHLLFTLRTEAVEHHKGQVSFPGGAADPADGDLLATALRETQEEIGLDPARVEVLGRLDDIITISRFLVSPFVGLVRLDPYPLAANHREVAAILEVRLADLLDGSRFRWERRQRDGEEVLLPAYDVGEHTIWGVTGWIVYEFLSLITGGESHSDAAPPPAPW